MGRNKPNKPPKQSKEDREKQKAFNNEMERLNEVCKEFAQKLVEEGFQTQVLTHAHSVLNNKVNTKMWKTQKFYDWQAMKVELDETPLKDLELKEGE